MVRTHLSTPVLESKADSPTALSLSTYFPAGTHYFYGYPAGDDSCFFNTVPPHIEELVAARAFCCAGPTVNVVCFAATAEPALPASLLEKLGIARLHHRQLCILPHHITAKLTGEARNKTIKEALLREFPPASLLMAQPYTDDAVAPLFQIPPKLTNWLNDKANLPHIIPHQYLPARLATYKNGAALARHTSGLPVPCVVKVSSSSSGDGVYVCQKPADLAQSAKKLQHVSGMVTVEAFINATRNYALQFGIPHDKTQAPALIGINEQLTTPDGSFIGGIITGGSVPQKLNTVVKVLEETILPAVRRLGWYGIGGIDVLEDQTGNFYFIDGNFRMTGMSALHLLRSQGVLQAPLVSFQGEFFGTQQELETALLPLIQPGDAAPAARLFALSRHEDTWLMNGAIMFAGQEELRQRANALMRAGVHSAALKQLCQTIPSPA